MKILNEFIKSSKLFFDYINKDENLSEFYPAHFKDESAWQKVMDRISKRRFDYSELARILKKQNLTFQALEKLEQTNHQAFLGENPPSIPESLEKLEVMEKIDRLAKGDAFAIVTGQQVGIFTGPLYTIYKAMTAIKLSQYLCEKYRTEFIPIFWMESNDHDIEEANHINLLDHDSELARFEYIPSDYIQGCSMKDVPVDDGFTDLIKHLEACFPETEFKGGIFEIIRRSYLAPESLSYGFGRMMAHLFGKYGLVLLDPSDPDIKKLMAPIFEREIESPLHSTEIVNSAGRKLISAGYESQIEKSDDSTCLFLEDNLVRRKLFFRDGHFELDGSNTAIDNILEVLHNSPWKFSPNVALRPVIQDYMIPTAAYIAGPGETSYFAQLSGLYDYLNVIMPVIYPRASFIVIESKIERIIEKNALSVSDLSEQHEKLFSRLSKNKASDSLEQLIESSRSGINSIFDKLSTDLTKFDPGMKEITESARKKIDYQVNLLKERAYQAQRNRDDILRNQIKRACMNIYPDGKPQERVFNVVQYLALYGLQFLDDILRILSGGSEWN